MELLHEIDAGMAQCASKGAPALVLSNKMLEEEPDSARIIQSAENLLGSCRALPDYVEAVSRSCGHLECMAGEDVVLSLQAQMPHIRHVMEAIVHFASRMGGKSGPHMQWWLFITNQFVPRANMLKANYLVYVANMPLGKPHQKR
jgi:hypothetical protein